MKIFALSLWEHFSWGLTYFDKFIFADVIFADDIFRTKIYGLTLKAPRKKNASENVVC